jgi:uncharacterized protein YecE (DUF72 family)
MPVYIGCAGWSLPRAQWPRFPAEGSHLQRYAQVFNSVEINTSFYRPHQPGTYARWAASVPAGFRFSVKLPKRITHEARLRDCAGLLDDFFAQALALGDRLGCLLVQLPPSLVFDEGVARDFFSALRQRYPGPVALEPRHASWREGHDAMLAFEIAQVAADPSPFREGEVPGGWPEVVYVRLHGSPRIYHSAYPEAYLEHLAQRLRRLCATATVWCLFDNTASGAAVGDALTLKALA